MKRLLAHTLFCALAALATPSTEAALLSVSLVPSLAKVHAGDQLFVDINLSGLQSAGADRLLGSWSLGFHYDSRLFTPLSVPPASFGGLLGDVQAGEALGGIDTSMPDCIGLFVVSLLTAGELDALQRDGTGALRDGFTLATVGLYAPIGPAFAGSMATFFTDHIVLGDENGSPLTDALGGPIPVQHLPVGVPIPEPSAIALALLALGAAGAARGSATARRYRA